MHILVILNRPCYNVNLLILKGDLYHVEKSYSHVCTKMFYCTNYYSCSINIYNVILLIINILFHILYYPFKKQ